MGLEKSFGGEAATMKQTYNGTHYLNRNATAVIGDGSVMSGRWFLVVHEVTNNAVIGLYHIKDGVISVDNTCPYCSISCNSNGIIMLQNFTTQQTGFTVYLYKIGG